MTVAGMQVPYAQDTARNAVQQLDDSFAKAQPVLHHLGEGTNHCDCLAKPVSVAGVSRQISMSTPQLWTACLHLGAPDKGPRK